MMCLQEIVRANEQVKIAADLVTKYRKNVQYNLEAAGVGGDAVGKGEHEAKEG